ncbi:hypothetical protein E2C01_095723 [Portunus trituberculatus]|uniref:Uncharacterized protein n=1 Tax=Portunus trituberculatus TaxID=210409 RepID=A0A5B7JW08_PORTR|nr:hypothetical protein [Portunus trituberculatus]
MSGRFQMALLFRLASPASLIMDNPATSIYLTWDEEQEEKEKDGGEKRKRRRRRKRGRIRRRGVGEGGKVWKEEEERVMEERTRENRQAFRMFS